MTAYPFRWAPLVGVGLVCGVVGNLTAVCRLGTIYSILIAVGFMKRWRRTGRGAWGRSRTSAA